jgi:hypothetical protein
LIGVSGQDPVIHIALTRVLEEVHGHLTQEAGPCKAPRVVAIDRYPNTVALTSLIHEGCGRREADEEAITQVEVPKGGSMTAVLTAVAVEMLARRLRREAGVPLPKSPGAGVTSMMVTVPATLRWTYFLERRRTGDGLFQRANLELVGEKGYVPLRADSRRVAESLRLRSWLRERMGMEGEETVSEALAGHGFVASPSHGCAFIPLGISPAELRAVPRTDLIAASGCLSTPVELEPILVAGRGKSAIGMALATGKVVSLP